MGSTENKEDNLSKATELACKAIDEGAVLIVLPELFNYLSAKMDKKRYLENAESINGPSIEAMKKLAKSNNVVIVAGSITEIEGNQLYNTSLVISSRGILGRYRKMHLFRYADIDENQVFTAGNKAEVVCFNGFKVGLTICFDLRFPELYRTEALMGAELIVNVAAFLEKTGRAHWMPLLRTRAIENQIFLVAANQATISGNDCKYYGHSCIIDPWGKVLTKAKGEQSVLVGDIKLERVREVRRTMPLLNMLRPDAYQIK